MWRRMLNAFPVLGFWLSLATLATVGALAYRSVARLVELNREVEHTHEVIGAINDVFLLLRDASTARRGYALSGDLAERAASEHATDQLLATRTVLRGLVADSFLQSRRAGELDALIDERVSRLKESLAYRDTHEFDRQHEDAFVAENRGRTKAVRELVGTMAAEEQRLLHERDATEKERAIATGRVLIAGAALSVCLLAVAFSVVRSENRARQRAQVVLTEANKKAEAANRELEAFSYAVAHDLRAPLRGMNGFARVLLEDYADKLDSDGTDALHNIQSGASRMGELIDALLSLARVTRSEIRRERVDLAAVARVSARPGPS